MFSYSSYPQSIGFRLVGARPIGLGTTACEQLATVMDNEKHFKTGPQRHAYSIDQAREALGGLGRGTIYSLISTGELRTFRLRNRRLISFEALAEFVRRREMVEQSGQDSES